MKDRNLGSLIPAGSDFTLTDTYTRTPIRKGVHATHTTILHNKSPKIKIIHSQGEKDPNGLKPGAMILKINN